MTDPIDVTHTDSIRAVAAIRAEVMVLRQQIARWTLPPYPRKDDE